MASSEIDVPSEQYIVGDDDISIDDDIDRSEDGGYLTEEDSYYSYDAEAEWEETKAQFNALFSLVIFPFAGRWLGKKVSFWLWSKYLAKPVSSPSLTLEWLNSLRQIAY
ncbi:hypothetical protein BCR43DRAFT_493861 [Syncephalastrum racemosum]|uniref:Uncharacterized protein n=1 Tax=Syncephalastrum racemosum TaxID=13706 RepID=A0A1X2HBE0_SYNRA|nr:hypothetical protein BCR43DRAFT_493861 [Syncephalastrum racemosum]